MTKQKKNSEKPSKDSKQSGQEAKETQTNFEGTLKFNLVHLLFVHGMLANFYKQKPEDEKLLNFVQDLCLLHEHYIDRVEDDFLKQKMNYSPININKDETQEKQTKKKSKK